MRFAEMCRFRLSGCLSECSRALLITTLRFAALVAAVALPLSLAAAGSGGTRQVQVMDPEFHMVAFTLNIPAGWNFQGVVLTGPGCDGDQSTFAYRAWSDDLRYGVQRTPQMNWFTPQDSRTPLNSNCKKMRQLSASAYGRMIAPTLRPGSAVTGEEAAPEAAGVANSTQGLAQVMAASAAQTGMPQPHFSSDVKRLRLEYMLGGQPEEEFMDVMEQTGETGSPRATNRPGQALQYQYMMTKKTTSWMVLERAPKGKLDAMAAMLDGIRSSMKINPDWDNKVAQWIKDRGAQQNRHSWQMTQSTLKMGQQQHDALMSSHTANMNQMDQQRQQRTDQFKAQQAQKAQGNTQFQAKMDARTAHTSDVTDFLLDQQYYVNPNNGNRSTISTAYSNNWENGTGEQVQTNLKGYDPNGDLPGNWTQLQPIQH